MSVEKPDMVERCSKPGCGALKAGPCHDWDCPQQFVDYGQLALMTEKYHETLDELFAARAELAVARQAGREEGRKGSKPALHMQQVNMG